MVFLEGTKKILQYLDVYTRPPLDIGVATISSRFIEYFAFISMIVTTIPIGVFCYINRGDFTKASDGVLYFMANTSIKVIYLAMLAKRKNVVEAIDHLEQLIQSRIDLNPKMKDFHTKRDEDNNKLAQTLLRSGVYTVLFFFLPNAMPPLTHCLFGMPKVIIWNTPFPVIVPFNMQSYLGFYTELSLQMFTVHFYMLIFSSMISIFYAFHKFIDGLVADYSMATEQFNEKLDSETHPKSKSDPKKRFLEISLQVRQFLKESIDLHLGISKAMISLQKITSAPLFFELFTFVAFLAINVFVFDRAIREGGLQNYETFLCLNNQLIQSVFCYVLCLFATKIEHLAGDITTITYGSDWYNYPVKEQSYLLLILQQSQKSFRFSGLGIVPATMATFLTLNRTAFSYYLVLRKSG